VFINIVLQSIPAIEPSNALFEYFVHVGVVLLGDGEEDLFQSFVLESKQEEGVSRGPSELS